MKQLLLNVNMFSVANVLSFYNIRFIIKKLFYEFLKWFLSGGFNTFFGNLNIFIIILVIFPS